MYKHRNLKWIFAFWLSCQTRIPSSCHWLCAKYTLPCQFSLDIKRKENIKIMIWYQNAIYQSLHWISRMCDVVCWEICLPFQRNVKRPTLKFGANFYWIPTWYYQVKKEYICKHKEFPSTKCVYVQYIEKQAILHKKLLDWEGSLSFQRKTQK